MSSPDLLGALHVVATSFDKHTSDLREILKLTKSYFENPLLFRSLVMSTDDEHKGRNHLIRSVRNGNIPWARQVISLLDSQASMTIETNQFMGKECYVCYEPFEETHIVYKLPCRGNHIFHRDCICKWVQYNSTCPYCRDPISLDDITAFLNRSTETEKSVLYYAIKAGDLPFVEQLIEKGAMVHYYNAHPLHLAAGFRHPEMVTYFLSKGEDIECTDRIGRTPLYYAAAYANAEMLQLLLDKGANIKFHYYHETEDTSFDTTFLHIAIEYKNIPGIQWILDNLSRFEELLEFHDKQGYTPLGMAVTVHSKSLVELLIKKGASLGGTFRIFDHPLYLAMKPSHYSHEEDYDTYKIFDYLLNIMDSFYLGTEEEETYKTFLSNLVFWALKEHYDTTYPSKILQRYHLPIHKQWYFQLARWSFYELEKTINFDTVFSDPEFFFHCLDAKSASLVKAILEKKPIAFDINQQDANGNTPAHFAKDHETLLLLKEYGCNFSVKNNLGQTPLHVFFGPYDLSGSVPTLVSASFPIQLNFTLSKKPKEQAQEGQESRPAGRSIFDVLTEEDDDEEEFIPPPAPRKKTVLTKKGVKSNRERVLEFFLEQGIDINAKDNEGNTALSLAMGPRNGDLVDFLLKKGADPKNASLGHDTFIHYAIKNAKFDMLDSLLANGMTLNDRNKNGELPLYGLLQNFQGSAQDDIPMLVQKGMDLNLPLTNDPEEKLYALHYAIRRGDLDLVKCLLEHGANPNVQDLNGKTPLHLASALKARLIRTLLLEKGADTTILDKDGHDADFFFTDVSTQEDEEEYEEVVEEVELQIIPYGDVTQEEANAAVNLEEFHFQNGGTYVFRVSRVNGELQVETEIIAA